MKNIYIIGEVIGSYRTQNLMKALLDNQNKIYYSSIVYLNHTGSSYSAYLFKRRIIKIIQVVLCFPARVTSILLADIIISPAMNNFRQFEFNLARLLNKKILTDYYISEYDSLVNDRKIVKKSTRKAKRLQRKDRNIILNADTVLFLNSTEAKRYLALAGLNSLNINYEIVPLCIEEKRKVKLPFFHKERDYLTICWWGTYIPLHGLNKIIMAGQVLKGRGIKYKLYLFGNSTEKSASYVEMVKQFGLSEDIDIVNDYTFQNGKLEQFLVDHCDIVLGNFGDSDKARSVLVNKLIDGTAMKAPVLTGESIAPREFFDGRNDIFYCQNTPKSIADSIELISGTGLPVIKARVEKAYEIYKKHFSVDSYREKILKIIDTI